MSEEYIRGYRDGFKDGHLNGFKAAKDNPYLTQPNTSNPIPTTTICSVCNIDFRGTWGYVCYRSSCPTRVSCGL